MLFVTLEGFFKDVAITMPHLWNWRALYRLTGSGDIEKDIGGFL